MRAAPVPRLCAAPKRDAQRRLRELLTEVDRGVAADSGKLTVGQWLEQWLAECEHTVAPKTWQERESFVRHHLAPALGAIRLDRLTPAAIQHYFTTALAGGRLDGKGGLSPQTVVHSAGRCTRRSRGRSS